MGTAPSSLGHATMALPVDLLECILDNLRDDKETLKACSLVCRPLSTLSRGRLFRVMSRRGRGYEDAGSLMKHIRHHPYATLVRVLELYAFGQFLCTRHVLPEMLSMLENLNELKLWGLSTKCVCEGDPQTPREEYRQHRHLKRLELSHVAHHSITLFLDFLGLFDEIHTLDINCDAILGPLPAGVALHQDMSSFIAEAAPKHLKIRAVTIRGSTAAITSRLLFHIIRVTPSVQTLDRLHATFDSAWDLRVCASLLPHCTSLHKLHLGQWVTFDQKGALILVVVVFL